MGSIEILVQDFPVFPIVPHGQLACRGPPHLPGDSIRDQTSSPNQLEVTTPTFEGARSQQNSQVGGHNTILDRI